MSGCPPGVKPTTMRIGRFGNAAASFCANAGAAAATAKPRHAQALMVCIFGMVPAAYFSEKP